MSTRFRQVIEAGVPEADWALVSGHAQLLLNTQGGVPSGAARDAVREYQALGRDQFVRMTHGSEAAALRGCGCPACARDYSRLLARYPELAS
jgi:hypothetical protein